MTSIGLCTVSFLPFCPAKLAVEMANPIQALNENFFYNSMLARALVQLMPISGRQTIRAWLEQLHRMDADSEEMTLRNDYMWFLLLMLQNKKLSTPFDRMPPRELRPIRDIVSENIYEEVVNAADQGASWIDQMTSKEDGDSTPSKPETISSPPAQFLANQPLPKNGIICYLAAFSDQDY